MREIIINDNNLKDEDISEKVIRVKGLMINSKGKILLAHNNNTYQFPGGHLEENENMDDCIVREIKEETGIDLEVIEEPFLCIKTYDNNYYNTGRKVLDFLQINYLILKKRIMMNWNLLRISIYTMLFLLILRIS